MWVQQGGEVPARARDDPAAERRVLERLREVAQRQAVLAQLLLEPRAGRAGLDARRARDGSTSSTRSSARMSSGARRVATSRLHAADDARAAAERDRRGSGIGAPVEQPLHVGLARAGARPHRAGGESGR